MNRTYGKIVDGKFIKAIPTREALPDGRGYIYKWISDADLASGEYKEVLTRGNVPSNVESLVRAGQMAVSYEDIGNYIVQTFTPVLRPVKK